MTHTLVVHTGPMKSSKSFSLIREYDLWMVTNRQAVNVFRPTADKRNRQPIITTRFNNNSLPGIPAILVENSQELFDRVDPQAACVLIDEAQLFDAELPRVIRRLLERVDVVASGLDLDYRGLPFGPMPDLMAMATTIQKYTAICDGCGSRQARFTQRLVDNQPASAFEETVVPEGEQKQVLYQARCASCFAPPTDLDAWFAAR